MLDIHPLYKGTRPFIFPSRAQLNPSPTSSSNTQSSGQVLRTFNHVTEQDIKKLKEARYLTAEILHRLPPRGQAVPSPEPNESVVFVSHFLRGLGLALDPFFRGLMFYYGLDFHDLAPDSFLHIMIFIVVCEAFLWVTPHFGLWLKTFEVKPKMIEGRHAACGGASICKMTGASWPKGSFPEVSEL